MTKKVIKIPFVEEVTGKPGAMVRFVEQKTESLDTTVQAAIDGLFVIGQAQLVKNNFLGLFKSMAEGVQRDGKPRKIADFLRIYPVFEGPIDLDKGFDPEVNGVYLAASLLNEMKLDISKWTFEDVTKGRVQMSVESITGPKEGVVVSYLDTAINGHNFPANADVEFQLEGGEVVKIPAEYVTNNVTRIDVKRGALAAIDDPENDGKKLTFTVRGNLANASKTVTFKASDMPPIKIVSKETGNENEVRLFDDELTVTGTEVPASTDIYLSLYDANGEMRARMEDQPTVHPERIDAKTWKYHIGGNTSTAIDDEWFEEAYTPYLTVERNGAEDLLIPIKTVKK